MKSIADLGNATRTVGQLFFALTLLLVAVAAGFGGTALIVYRHLDGGNAATRTWSERKVTGQIREKAFGARNEDARLRQAAAFSADQAHYTYAANNGGQPSTPAKRERPATSVPAPLGNPASSADAPNPAAGLNDPESVYIVDSHTGRVIGIDGSVGARRENDDEQRRLESAPRAVAVQTPMPEVRVASAVTDDHQDAPSTEVGSQYLPVRRALPVVADAAETQPRQFNVAEYMAGGQARPVLRARPVAPGSASVPRAVRAYRLPDGSQIVAAD